MEISISLNVEFCIEALEDALARYDTPTILNSDRSLQLTSTVFTPVLHREKIAISMDGKGCWRSVKYEEVYLNAYGAQGPRWHRPAYRLLQCRPAAIRAW